MADKYWNYEWPENAVMNIKNKFVIASRKETNCYDLIKE